jgi:hypothetical protein
VISATRFSGLMAVLLCACLHPAVPAAAQWGTGTTGGEYMPRFSTAEEVAITQHVLSADAPSATEWARHSREYKAANDFDREAVLERKRSEYVEKFRLFTKPETLVIGANVQLSAYSETNKGFVIESFSDETFFSYTFAGQSYAIVIPKLMDYQWMSIDPAAAKELLNATPGSKGKVRMVIEIDPKFADKNPIELHGKKYRPLAGEVASLSAYPLNSNRAYWARNGIGRAEKNRNEMINLFGRSE